MSYEGIGFSVTELSHRSDEYAKINRDAQDDFRELLLSIFFSDFNNTQFPPSYPFSTVSSFQGSGSKMCFIFVYFGILNDNIGQ